MTLLQLQDLVARLYADRNVRRGVDGSIQSLAGGVQRLPAALDGDDLEEHARVLAYIMVDLTSVAIGLEVNLEEATRLYIHGCPECGNNPCDCN